MASAVLRILWGSEGRNWRRMDVTLGILWLAVVSCPSLHVVLLPSPPSASASWRAKRGHLLSFAGWLLRLP